MTRRATLFIVITCGVLLVLAALAVQAFSENGAGGALLPLSPQTSAAPVDYVARGDRLAAERQFDSAAASYRTARDAAPADPALTRKLIDLYVSRHRYTEAATEIERFLAAQPADTATLVQAAQVYSALNRPADASTAWQRVLEIEPDNAAAHVGLADLAFAAGDWANARTHFVAATRGNATDTRSLFYTALLTSTRDVDAALALAQKASAGPAGDWTGRAVAFATDLQSAREATEPAYRQTRVGLALVRQGAYALAVMPLEGAVGAFPNYRDAHAYLGHALWATGDPTRAEAHLQKALDLDPNYPPTRYFMALLRRSQGRFAESADLLEGLVRADARNAGWWIELARTYDALGNYDVAAKAYARAVSLDPTRTEYLLEQVNFHVEHAWQPEAALASAQILQKMEPDNGAILDLVGWTMHLSRAGADAKGLLTQAEALDPDYGGPAYHLGLIYATEGNWEEARRCFVRSMANDLSGRFAPKAQTELETLDRQHPESVPTVTSGPAS